MVAAVIHSSLLLLPYTDLQVSCVETHAHEDLARLALVRLYKKALMDLNTSRSLLLVLEVSSIGKLDAHKRHCDVTCSCIISGKNIHSCIISGQGTLYPCKCKWYEVRAQISYFLSAED
jgi:hypothetical protein